MASNAIVTGAFTGTGPPQDRYVATLDTGRFDDLPVAIVPAMGADMMRTL